MPKRRRGGHSKTKTTPGPKEEKVEEIATESPPEAEVEEEEDDEVAAAVDQMLNSATSSNHILTNLVPVVLPPVELPVIPSVPTTAQLQVARTRLTGLLHRVNKPLSAEGEEEDEDDEPLAQSIVKQQPPESPPEKRSSPAPSTPVVRIKSESAASASSTPSSAKNSAKRRKKRDGVLTDSAFHHTYVMKLFDRSVDLAQFSETTSLYPVCRAWMANQPRNPNLVPRRRSPTPPPSEDEDEKEEKDDDSTKGSNEGENMKNVYKMPLPTPCDHLMRVPSPDQHIVQPIIINQEGAEGGKDERMLLSEHVEHWRSVKSKWMHAGHQNEQRYEDSISIIEEIYKKAQELYA